MAILDENNLLSAEESAAFQRLLKAHHYERHHFLLEVEEDQDAIDMNDINYIIIVKTTATHVKEGKSKAYRSQFGTGTWLTEFEQDLKNGYFTNI